MYFELGSIPIWQSKDLIEETMPIPFKERYPATRCILDCTEIKICKPSSLRAQSQYFSSYKNTTTAEGLLGIAPSGAPVFISDPYSGSISDKDITKQSGILELLVKGETALQIKDLTFKIYWNQLVFLIKPSSMRKKLILFALRQTYKMILF